jgi:putative PEP-CTERM system TPR-repeat lipoprotein
MAFRTNFTRFHAAFPVGLVLLLAACSSPEAQKKQHFEQGNKYAAEKRDDFAVIEYANAVRIDPKFGEARWKLAQTYERMNNVQAAFPEYIRAADALPDNREAQIKATELLLLARQFEDAKARAATLLVKNPKDVDALLLRANAMAALKDPERAMADVEEALKIQPSESRAFLSLATIRMQTGEAQEAEAAFKQAITLQPSSARPRLAYANFLWSAGRPNDAERELKEAISLEPRYAIANRMLAALYAATNRLDLAEQPLKVVAEVSASSDAKFELAEYYLRTRRPQEAKKLLTELGAAQAAFSRAEAMLASMDYDAGRVREAHARLDKILERAPKDAPALTIAAHWLANEKKLDEALDRAKSAVGADAQSAPAYYALGVVHRLRREVSDAIKAYSEALRLNPRLVEAQVELSRLNLASGNPEAALRYAEEAKQTAPANAAVRLALARSLLAQGELGRAGTEIAQLQTALPNSAAVHILNGRLHAMRNNEAAARTSYERALELSPEDVDAVGLLAGLDLKNKQIDAAVQRVEAALALHPDRAELLAIAATVYDQTGQNEKAEQTLRRAVAADPRFSAGYAMLAQLYMKQRRLDEARAEFEGIVKRDPRAVGARTMVGVILESQGKRAEAKRWYEMFVADVGNSPIAANNLAFIYADDGTNLDTALQLASFAKKEMPESAEVNDTLGWVYYKKDLATLAVGPLEESVKKNPNSADVLYHLGMTYAKTGEKAKSRELLERALKLNPKMPGAASARQTLATVSQ